MKVKLDFKKKFLFARTKREGISIKKVNFISFSQNVCTFICISYIININIQNLVFKIGRRFYNSRRFYSPPIHDK